MIIFSVINNLFSQFMVYFLFNKVLNNIAVYPIM